MKPGAWLDSLTSAQRKEVAVARGLYAYFPDALALIARHSHRSNEKHNTGEPLHWSREKSSDHEDCVARHSIAIAVDPNSLDDGQPHIVCRAWRALAALQLWAEAQVPKVETSTVGAVSSAFGSQDEGRQLGAHLVQPDSISMLPDKNGWIEWFGGSRPVDDATRIDFVCQCGYSDDGVRADSLYDDWPLKRGEPHSILRYRVSR